MKKTLLISYNLLKENEEPIPLSIASILAKLESDPSFRLDFDIDHLPINMADKSTHVEKFETYLNYLKFDEYQFICVSCFVWNEYLINPLINFIRNEGFQGKIILGGSQITYSGKANLKIDYPDADIFISGYAEESLLQILKNGDKGQIYYNLKPDFSNLPSPYIQETIPIKNNQTMLRWETKRGCPFRCSFCAHRELENGRVYYMDQPKAFKELEIFRKHNVKRINVLDPIFNMGPDYINILNEIRNLNFHDTVFTFQSKMELLDNDKGNLFLELVKEVNAHLEFGIQTIVEEEFKVIDRANNLNKIKKQLVVLKERGVSYEVSLIYGLPNQTYESFCRSIDFLMENGCNKITAWPLMLLKGTPLIDKKATWNLNEEVLGEYQIPLVTSSNSFSKNDWLKMKDKASQLSNSKRFS